ncbi:MAG: calcium-binding protein, partial [Rubripirellula sp.]
INAGSEDDTINVGSDAPGTNSQLAGISAQLIVNGDENADTLNINDKANGDPATGTITPTTVSGFKMAGFIYHETTETVNLTAGDAGTTLLIEDTANHAVKNIWSGDGPDLINVRKTGGSVNLYLQADDDIVNVGTNAPATGSVLNHIGDLLTLSGGLGVDALNLDDTSDVQGNAGVMTANKISGLGMAEGVAYQELESLEVSLGQGDDTMAVTGAMKNANHTAISVLNMGGGLDNATIELQMNVDGAFALNAEGGKDVIDASKSTAPNIIFGGADTDTIIAGQGADIVIGDRGKIDYRDNNGQLIRRLGISLAERTYYDPSNAEKELDVPSLQNAVQPFSMAKIETRDTHLGDDDSIQSGGGPDLILGGKGDEQITAGDEDSSDIILGDHGHLRLDPQGYVIEALSTGSSHGGSDTIQSGGGGDFVIAGDGSDDIHAGAGGDIVLADHGMLSWRTSVSPPVLIEARSTESALGGDDEIQGGDGTDVIVAGFGSDMVDAGTDNSSDIVVGDNGYALFDELGRLIEVSTADHDFGGVDIITTANARDYVMGGDEGDTIRSNGGHDVVLGDTGTMKWTQTTDPPTLISITSPSEDTSHGGNDCIDAGDGNDLAFGGTGSDTLFGRTGDDVLSNYQMNVTIPLPDSPSFSGWGDQELRYLWDQPMSLWATENFTPLKPEGDFSTGTGDSVDSNNSLYGEQG